MVMVLKMGDRSGFAGGSYGQTDFEVTKLLAEQGEAFAQYNL